MMKTNENKRRALITATNEFVAVLLIFDSNRIFGMLNVENEARFQTRFSFYVLFRLQFHNRIGFPTRNLVNVYLCFFFIFFHKYFGSTDEDLSDSVHSYSATVKHNIYLGNNYRVYNLKMSIFR